MLRKVREYYSGKTLDPPRWMARFPFLLPAYQGDETFKWFGLIIPAPDAKVGETLFSYWRRMCLERTNR